MFLKGGNRLQGARKIVAIPYNGRRNPVSELEILNIGEVVRHGRLLYGGDVEGASDTSHRYEMEAEDGAKLRVVVDFDKKSDETVVNYYSDQKVETGAVPGEGLSGLAPGQATSGNTGVSSAGVIQPEPSPPVKALANELRGRKLQMKQRTRRSRQPRSRRREGRERRRVLPRRKANRTHQRP